jgi:two-component system, sensor histidine kinase and response regulator
VSDIPALDEDAIAATSDAVLCTSHVTQPEGHSGASSLAEQHFRDIFESAPDAIVTCDMGGRIALVNAQAENLFGYTREELLGRPVEMLLDEAIRERHVLHRTGYVADPHTRPMGSGLALHAHTKDGRDVPVEISLSPLSGTGDPQFMAVIRDVTARQEMQAARMRTEEALRASEERLRGIFNQTAVGMALTTPDGRLLDVNQAVCRMLGYTKQELLHQQYVVLTHPDDLAESRERIRQMLAGEIHSTTLEKRYLHKHGHIIWTQYTASLLRAPDGRPQNFIYQWQDISARMAAESLLRQAEQRYRTLLESAPDAILTCNAEGHIVLINSQAEAMFGYRREELLGQSVDILLPEGLQDVHTVHRSSYARQPHTRPARPLTACRKDGREIAVEVSLSPINSDDEMLVTAVVRDISVRVEAERMLHEQAELLDLAHDAIIVRGFSGNRILFWNQGAEALYGWSAEQAQGQITHVLLQTRFPTPLDAIMAGMLSDDSWRGELGHTARDGTQIVVESRWVLRRDTRGQPNAVLEINRDITDRKRAELALAAKNADLEQLYEALHRANAVKAEFLATMSHEIRTPMNGVIGMAGLLLETDLTGEQLEYAESVRLSGEALLTLVNDILDFSKIEAGRLELEVGDFEVQEIVDDVLELLAPQARTGSLDVGVLIAPAVPRMLRGDVGRLRQVLMNLVGNAIKFTHAGAVTVNVKLEATTGDSAMLCFLVTDTGMGITPEVRTRLFQMFTQGDGSTTRRFGGSGLGLAISKRLVELMGGTIGVLSTPEQGSTFWFTVPLELADRAATTPPEIVALQGRRAIVVDNKATSRASIAGHLTAAGMRIDLAEDGSTALGMLRTAAAKGQPYEFALVDLHMGDMDGLAIAEVMRNDPAMTEVRLMMLAAASERSHARDVITTAAVLTKPVRRKYLYQCLVAALDDSLSSGENAAFAGAVEPAHGVRRQGRVLVAEDNAINQRVAARMLELRAYYVDVVANGREAIESLARIPYDLVFMDCQMPEMDGFEATAIIRRHEEDGSRRRTPIIAMTANALAGDHEKCLAAGMDDYLSKPLAPDRLDAVLVRWSPVMAAKDAEVELAPRITMDSASILDPTTRRELHELQDRTEPDLLAELCHTFVQDATARVAALREAEARRDWEGLQRTVHALKGSCGSMGAVRMYDACVEIEALARGGEYARVYTCIESLDTAFELTQGCLRAENETPLHRAPNARVSLDQSL